MNQHSECTHSMMSLQHKPANQCL